MTTATQAANANRFAKQVDEHALANYEKGWDIWIETMDQEEKVAVLKTCRTTKGAISRAWKEIKDYVAYRNEVQATEF